MGTEADPLEFKITPDTVLRRRGRKGRGSFCHSDLYPICTPVQGMFVMFATVKGQKDSNMSNLISSPKKKRPFPCQFFLVPCLHVLPCYVFANSNG